MSYKITGTGRPTTLGRCEHQENTRRCHRPATVVVSPVEGFWNTLEDLFVCQAHADVRTHQS